MKASMLQYLKSSSPKQCGVNSILNYIRTNPNADKIEYARTLNKKHPDYNKTKFEVTSWMPHGVFENGVNDSNINQFSSYIYFDLDDVINVEEIKNDIKRFPFVYACWRSFGGNGLGFLVRVDGIINKETFKEAWEQVAMKIDLSFDKQAKSLSRKNVISYDPHIWVNNNCAAFKYQKKKNSIIKDSYERTIATYPLKEKRQYAVNVHLPTVSHDTPLQVRSTLKQEEFYGEPFLYFDEGKSYCDIYIHDGKIPLGRRRIGLLSIIAKLIYLNPSHPKDSILKFVYSLNESYCTPPMSGEEVNSSFNFLWTKYESNTLTVSTRKRYLWFNPKVHMSNKERAKVCQTVSARKRKENTNKKILKGMEIIKKKYQPINFKSLATASGVSYKTVLRRKNEFQFIINVYNNALKETLDSMFIVTNSNEYYMFRKERDFTLDIISIDNSLETMHQFRACA